MRRISERFHFGQVDRAVFVLGLGKILHNRGGISLANHFEQTLQVVHGERDILHTVAVLDQMIAQLLVAGQQWRFEHKHDIILLHHMTDDLATSRLQATVGVWLEAQLVAVVTGRLLCIANNESKKTEIDGFRIVELRMKQEKNRKIRETAYVIWWKCLKNFLSSVSAGFS